MTRRTEAQKLRARQRKCLEKTQALSLSDLLREQHAAETGDSEFYPDWYVEMLRAEVARRAPSTEVAQ